MTNSLHFPDFLIVGAMKSATTSLFMDLGQHPKIFLPDIKEPHCLVSDDVLTTEGKKAYAKHYEGARADQWVCDGSTGYTKMPDIQGVVSRAQQILGPDFKVVYMVRHPIERIKSHYRHEFLAKIVTCSADEAVRTYPRYVNYSRYGYQLQPWVEALGIDRVMVVRFEDYKKERQQVVQRVCQFLGLPTEQLPQLSDQVYNRSEGKPVVHGFWRRVYNHPFYREWIRPRIPLKLRLQMQQVILPNATIEATQITEESADWLSEQLEEDVRQISNYSGKQDDLWQLKTR